MPHAGKRSMSAPEWAMLIGLSVLWGGSFFFTGIAFTELPPLTFVVLRVGIAALILNLVLPFAGLRLPGGCTVWAAFLGMGLLNNVEPFCLIVLGQTHIASGFAAILNATMPLFTVIVAHRLTTDEWMTGNRFSGALVGLAGVATMVGPAAFAGLDASLLAQVAILGAALSYACAGVFGRRFKRMGIPPLAVAAGQLTVGRTAGVARCAGDRPAVDIAGPRSIRLGSNPRHRHAVDRACLRPLFPAPGHLRGDQPVAGHLLVPVSAILLGGAGPGRTSGTTALSRDGPDQMRPRGHRRAPPAPRSRSRGRMR